jgi:predicted transcriptional regulator
LGELRKSLRPTEHDDLCGLIADLTARVAQLEGEALKTGNRTPALGYSDEKLATIATSMFRARIHRANQFNPVLFGEPAWDMLLDLFIQKVAGRRVSSTSLCLGANVPYATGARYIERLEGEGLVLRFTPPDDKRLVLIDYTPDGFHRMRDYISQAVTRFRVPLPD